MCDEQLSVGNSLSQLQKRGHTIQLFVLPSAGIIRLAVCKHKLRLVSYTIWKSYHAGPRLDKMSHRATALARVGV